MNFHDKIINNSRVIRAIICSKDTIKKVYTENKREHCES